MNRKQYAIILLLIWIVIFFSCCAINYFFLRHPIGDAMFADHRLIPPTLHKAKKVAETASNKEMIELMGYPNSSDSNLSISNATYELQFGYVVTFCIYGDNIYISQISEPFTSTRWLIFPTIMLLVSVAECVFFLIIRKTRQQQNAPW